MQAQPVLIQDMDFGGPSNIVSKITEDLIAFGTVQRGWLGIEIRNVDSNLAKQEGLDLNEGAYVSGYGNAEDMSGG